MEQCQNCKHERKAHLPDGCGCGCAVYQPSTAPIIFNSITAGEEIMQQMETLNQRSDHSGARWMRMHLLQRVLVELSLWGTSIIGLAVQCPDGKYFGSPQGAGAGLRSRP